MRSFNPFRASTLALAIGLLLTSVAAATAQDGTPGTTDAPAAGYPVAVHEGTCADPTAQPAFEIGDAVPRGSDSEDEVETIGIMPIAEIFGIGSTLDTTLDDMSETVHVIAVHASAEDFGTVIGCGQIAGVEQDGRVVVALAPTSGGTITGIAFVDTDEAGLLGLGDEQVQVTVYLFDTAAAEETVATPAA